MNELQFNEGKHEYSVGGTILPGVTSIISGMGLSGIPYKILQELKSLKNGEIEVCHLSGKALAVYQAGQFGTAAHRACELEDEASLDMKSLDSAILPYLEAWRQFKKETGVLICLIEDRVYHPFLGFAGTIDRTGIINDKKFIIDIKTSAEFPSCLGLQTAAYKGLYVSNYVDRNSNVSIDRMGVLLKPDATYRLADDSLFKKTDWNNFLSALSLYKLKKNMFKERS